MFFTSPAFVFLFLPLALLFYATLGKSNRSFSLLFISISYQLLMILINPLIPISLALLILYTFGADHLLRRIHRRSLLIALCAFPFLLLILLRALPIESWLGCSYPYGFAFGALSATSFLADSYSGYVNTRRSFFHLCRYLLFFPIMIAGPVIQYRDFAHITDEQRIHFHLHNMSIGAKLFMIGFIKRIAIGAVFMETYETLVDLGSFSPNLFVACLSVLVVFFATYFTLSGYAEMGVGIARMFGIRLAAPYPLSLSVATPKHYLNHFLSSFGDWIQRYLISPFPSLANRHDSWHRFLRSCIYCLFLSLFLRSEWYMIPATLPLILLSYALSKSSRSQAIKNQSGFRILSGFLSLFIIAIYWSLILSGGIGDFWSYVLAIRTDNPEYRFNMLLAAFSNLRYILVVVIAVLLLVFQSGAWLRLRKRLSPKTRTVSDFLLSFSLLLLFLFTILFFLPQYPIYNDAPYLRLIL